MVFTRQNGPKDILFRSPLEALAVFYRHWSLIKRLTSREIESRYRGSLLGMLWAILTPLLMLAVYTYVFSTVFQARWGELGPHRSQFAVVLFSGLVLFNLFSESVSRAPSLMLSNVSYIKKVLFPLEVLPCVVLLVALFNAMTSLLIMAFFYGALFGVPPWSAVLLPLVFLPLLALTLGLTWFLAAVGVYLRDTGQFVGILILMLLFLSPVFYPLSAVPESYRRVLGLSPITMVLEDSKQLLFVGEVPSVANALVLLVSSLVICWLGYCFFMKTKKGFADVI